MPLKRSLILFPRSTFFSRKNTRLLKTTSRVDQKVNMCTLGAYAESERRRKKEKEGERRRRFKVLLFILIN